MGRKQTTKPDYYTQREWGRIQAREKAQKRASRNLVLVLILLLALVCCMVYAAWFFIFRSHDSGLIQPYSESDSVFGIHSGSGMLRAVPFADGLCVTDTDVDADAIFSIIKNDLEPLKKAIEFFKQELFGNNN